MSPFQLKATVHENVLELRVALGSATRKLSRDDLAQLIAKKHSTRGPNGTSVQRWEEGGEPDYESARIMAELAGVTFEEFALGRAGLSRQQVPVGPAEERQEPEERMIPDPRVKPTLARRKRRPGA